MATRRKKAKAKPRSEREIGAPAVKWLKANGWTVLEELTVTIPEGVVAHPKIWKCDIIATQVFDRGVMLIAWEVKRALSVQVITQANRWRPYVHRASVVVAHPGRFAQKRDEHQAMLKLARDNGVGVIYVTRDDEVSFASSDPKMPSRRAQHNPEAKIAPIQLAIRKALEAEERRVAAGCPSKHQPAGTPAPLGDRGQDEHCRWHKVRQYVAANKGATSKEIKRECRLTKSDTNDLIRLARAGKLEGINTREFVGQLLFYPKETRHA